MRFIAIDLGGKRTGLAVGDDQTGIVSPVASVPIAPGAALVRAILDAIDEHHPDAIVLGLPLNMDGTEGPGERTDRPIHYQDERLTSYAADQRMARSGRTRKEKKERRDALAAVEILRDFLGEGTEGLRD
jgi:putative Holliday junction resolvase